MHHHLRILLILSSLAFIGFFLFFLRTSDLSILEKIKIESFMRNTTWQTDFGSRIPYKKGDEIEYSFVLSSEVQQDVRIHIDAIEKNIDITKIEINGEEVDKNTLNSLLLTDSSLLKITGKTKNTSDSTTEKMDNSALIDVEVIETKEPIITKEEPVTGTILQDPKNLYLKTASFNSNIANLLEIGGDNLESIAFVNIGGIGLKPVFVSGTAFVPLDPNIFATGDYFILLQLTNGKILTMDDKIHFEYISSRINIADITPDTIRNDADRFLVIQGNGFDKIVSIQMSNNLILKNAEFTIINKQVAGVKIPKGLSPGVYYFNIMDTGSIYELKNMKFTITE